jgi:hypothetical protein
MIYSLTIKNMVGDNKLDYERYRDRFREIYPSLSEEEREEIFYLRVQFWEMIIENYQGFI